MYMNPNVTAAIYAALESKDQLSAQHCKNVAQMAGNYCRACSFGEYETAVLSTAAYLHDVGKIGIPDAVLNYPGKLGDSGLCLIRAHPEIGAHITAAGGLTDTVVFSILHHHEAWDGSGYPYGLQGEEIPFGARILAVLDSIDAMCGTRYYRKAVLSHKCQEELKHCSGTLYDTSVVITVLDHWEDIVYGLYPETK